MTLAWSATAVTALWWLITTKDVTARELARVRREQRRYGPRRYYLAQAWVFAQAVWTSGVLMGFLWLIWVERLSLRAKMLVEQ